MKKITLLFMILLFSHISFAQDNQADPAADSTLYRWMPSLVTSLNLSQIAFSNWTKGGENSIAWSLGESFVLKFKTPKWHFKNELSSAYGQSKVGSEDFKVTDNELYMESVAAYSIGWAVDPYISNTIRTQVAAGYEYTDTSKTEVANFFDPGYITQSIGFTYDKLENFQSRLGIAFQETITDKYTQYADDPDTPNEIESFRFETGIESVTDGQFTLDENLLLKSKLRLFSAFDRLDVWDVRWDNVITAKVNNWLNVNFTYLLVYQKDQSPKTQMKQALQIGITYTIL